MDGQMFKWMDIGVLLSSIKCELLSTYVLHSGHQHVMTASATS